MSIGIHKYSVPVLAMWLAASVHAAVDVGFESGVPASWSGSTGGLSVSGYHYKEGSQSLQWDWGSGDVLTVTDLQSQGLVTSEVQGYYENTFYMWVYNEAPLSNETVTVSFKDGNGNVQYHYWFYLNWKGWRPVSISYRYEMFGNKNSQDLQTMTLQMPAVAGGGTVFIDRVDFTGDRITSSASSTHIPYKLDLGDNHWSRMRYYSELPRNHGGETPTEQELADLVGMKNGVLDYIRGSSPSASNLSAADSVYATLGITTNPDGTVKGKPLFGKEHNDSETIELLDNVILHYARDFYHNGSAGSRTKFMQMIRHTLDQGYQSGCVMETVHHIGYSFRPYPLAVLLMEDELKAEGLWDEAYAMACWFAALDGIWEPTAEVSNMDAGNTRTIARYCCIFFKDTVEEQVQYLKGLRDYVQVWATPQPQTGEGVKPDYTGFHHNHYYPARYVAPAYKSISWAVANMSGTEFGIDAQAYDHLKKCMLVQRLNASAKDMPMSLAGRGSPLTTINSISSGIGYLVNSPVVDGQLARAYNLMEPSDAVPGYQPEEYPNGFWQLNYAPMGVYRDDDWVADIKGFNNHFMGQEIYAGTSQYSRYAGYGAVEILYAGGNGASGKREEGWNWNATPGGTTIHLPWTQLNANGREDEKTDSIFCGALRFGAKAEYYLEGEDALEGEIGLFAMDFQQKNLSANHNPTFRFKKSVFCIDGKLICLGSGIQNDDAANATITTLFQNHLQNTADAVVVDGVSETGFPLDQTLGMTGNRWLLDNVGTGYYVPAGNDSIKLTKMNQTSPQQDGTGTYSGNFAVAWLDHETSPLNSKYEYVAVPKSSAAEMASFAGSAGAFYSVVKNDAAGHIVKSGSVEAYALFAPNSSLAGSVVKGNSDPCLVMLEGDGIIDLTLVNPVLNFDGAGVLDAPVPVELILNGTWAIIDADAGISLVSTNGSETTLRFQTNNGEPLDVQLANPHAEIEERTFQFTPIHDAHSSQNDPSVNYGANAKMAIRSDKFSKAMHGYLMFDADTEGMIPLSAMLRLYCSHNDIILTVHDVADTSWTEGALTWNQQPAIGGVVDSHSVVIDSWESFDVTASVSGAGKLSFGLMSNEGSYSNVDTKEGANVPVLEVVAVSLGGDKDADGLPNGWEFEYFGGATNATVSVDDDGDGFDNLAEFIAGTNPTNAGSFFAASSTNLSSGFVVEWSAVSNRSYGVWHSVSLTNAFTNLASGILFPQGAYTDTAHNAVSAGFYKVDVQRAD
ncbi:Chondroitin sulfate ABC endolyase [Pontiella desulfatans]|uniref:Chondroitin sulfate ABC endolyase n=1 Tax=Pontiella desulfatans TaxID=2750659 RepID=A0A6C2U2P4_PONDE|nr:chondroitinase family polysaccharide lyase [Pontiella desulfatans]VGO14173.1 Chondroitin sulfate ABC endolyase [Pontiella desulfatans]